MSITDITAIVALMLSVVSLYWQWHDKRLRLGVKASIALARLPVGADEIGSPVYKDVPALRVYIYNPGEKSVHITSVFLQVGNKRIELLPFGWLEPSSRTVDPYRAHELVVPRPRLSEELEKEGYSQGITAKVFVQDEIGTIYRSNPLKLSIKEL